MQKTHVLEQIKATREGGRTERCHAMDKHTHYNVAIHSYNALNLLLLIYPGRASHELIKAILWHDVPERWTGDVPTPAKLCSKPLADALANLETGILNRFDLFTYLTDEEQKWLNGVDLLELWLWVLEEIELGNASLVPMHTKITELFEQRKHRFPPAIYEVFISYQPGRLPDCDIILGE